MPSVASAPPPWAVHLAETVAACRPRRVRCDKSQRGVVIYHPGRSVDHAVTGGNGPPPPFRCKGRDHCKGACNQVAVHAEERAIIKAGRLAAGADMVHVKMVNYALVPSGPPSCWQCSRMVVEAKLHGVWLFRSQGWEFYTAALFHEMTLHHHEMPMCIDSAIGEGSDAG